MERLQIVVPVDDHELVAVQTAAQVLDESFPAVSLLVEVSHLEETVACGREFLDREVEGGCVCYAVDRQGHRTAHYVHRELEMLEPGEIFLLVLHHVPTACVAGFHHALQIGTGHVVLFSGSGAGHHAVDFGQAVDQIHGGMHVAVAVNAAAVVPVTRDLLDHLVEAGTVVRAAGERQGAGKSHQKAFHGGDYLPSASATVLYIDSPRSTSPRL